MIRKWLTNVMLEQTASLDGVVPEHRWSDKDNAFYLNSPAGLLKFKPKNALVLARFRDRFVNEFDAIAKSNIKAETKVKLFFKLYAEIRKAHSSARYTANVSTRLKGALCNFRA